LFNISNFGTAINAKSAIKLKRNPKINQPKESRFFSLAMNAQKPPKIKHCSKIINAIEFIISSGFFMLTNGLVAKAQLRTTMPNLLITF